MLQRILPLFLLALPVLLQAPTATAQSNFVLRAACIGGAANTRTEVAATANGTISRRRYYAAGGNGWQVLGRDPNRVKRWLKRVDATKMSRVRVPATVDRNPCKVGSSRPCHIVRRKGNVDYYACSSESVLKEMMDFNEWTNAPRADGAFKIMEEWTIAFENADVDALMELYAPDALFMGAGDKIAMKDRMKIREYFESAFLAHKSRRPIATQQENKVLSANMVVVTTTSLLNKIVDGRNVADRVTIFVIAKRGTRWLIVRYDSSATPN